MTLLKLNLWRLKLVCWPFLSHVLCKGSVSCERLWFPTWRNCSCACNYKTCLVSPCGTGLDCMTSTWDRGCPIVCILGRNICVWVMTRPDYSRQSLKWKPMTPLANCFFFYSYIPQILWQKPTLSTRKLGIWVFQAKPIIWRNTPSHLLFWLLNAL